MLVSSSRQIQCKDPLPAGHLLIDLTLEMAKIDKDVKASPHQRDPKDLKDLTLHLLRDPIDQTSRHLTDQIGMTILITQAMTTLMTMPKTLPLLDLMGRMRKTLVAKVRASTGIRAIGKLTRMVEEKLTSNDGQSITLSVK